MLGFGYVGRGASFLQGVDVVLGDGQEQRVVPEQVVIVGGGFALINELLPQTTRMGTVGRVPRLVVEVRLGLAADAVADLDAIVFAPEPFDLIHCSIAPTSTQVARSLTK